MHLNYETIGKRIRLLRKQQHLSQMELAEMYREEWVTADRLSERLGMFSTAWLKRYGYLLPRERAEVVEGAEMHATRWAYPLHKIQRLLMEGKLKGMQV